MQNKIDIFSIIYGPSIKFLAKIELYRVKGAKIEKSHQHPIFR